MIVAAASGSSPSKNSSAYLSPRRSLILRPHTGDQLGLWFLGEKRDRERRDVVPPSPLAMVLLSSISAQAAFFLSFLSIVINEMYFLFVHMCFLRDFLEYASACTQGLPFKLCSLKTVRIIPFQPQLDEFVSLK
jgi:hypothetical protein